MTGGVRITVVGIGADGWDGLAAQARAAILAAEEVIGSPRQLGLLPADTPPQTPWPSPMAPAVDALVARPAGTVCVVASGDPMLHGIGATLAIRSAPGRLTVIPHVSAFALACARLGWAEAEAELVSAVARPAEGVALWLQPGRRLVVYPTGRDGAARVARVLCERGFATSRLVVLERLGAGDERITETTAAEALTGDHDPLHAVAIECTPDPGTSTLARTPGLPDAAYDSDGALTKWPVRAVTLAALAPIPGALLWDVGAGSGSVAIEWLRAEPTARAIAVERRADRRERIARNALRLGVPALEIVAGDAPAALTGLPVPDAVFLGGGVSVPGLLDAGWQALRAGGRIVANAVTLEGEGALVAARAARGGDLVRLEVAHAAPIGGFTGWRPQMPVVVWSARKP
jgi:precorrin-6Y C5,15-methyltransferase (decarboxylating)